MSPVGTGQAAVYARGNIKFPLDRPADVRQLALVEAQAGGATIPFEAAGLRRHLSKFTAADRTAAIAAISAQGTASATRVAAHLNAWLTEVGTPADPDPWITSGDA